MALRSGRFGKFWGCLHFPACKGTHKARADGTPCGVPANTETRLLRRKVLVLLAGIQTIHHLGPAGALRFLEHVTGHEIETAALTQSQGAQILRRYAVATRTEIEAAQRVADVFEQQTRENHSLGSQWDDWEGVHWDMDTLGDGDKF